MKKIKISSAFAPEKIEVFFYKNAYARGNYLYVGICAADGEPFADLTVNLPKVAEEHPIIRKQLKSGKYAFIDTANLYCDVVERLEELSLIEDTGLKGFSGYNVYPLYRFSEEFLDSWCAKEEENEK